MQRVDLSYLVGRLIFSMVLACCFCTGSYAQTIIDFDDGTDLQVVGASYAEQGVIFTNAKRYDWVTRGQTRPGASANFMIGGEQPASSYPVDIFPQEDTPIIADFSAPMVRVSITAISVGWAGARLVAFDDQGTPLDADEQYGILRNGAGEYYVLSVSSSAGIASVRMYQPSYDSNDGLFWDNLKFSPCVLRADLSGDCCVNLIDLAIFVEKWLYDTDCSPLADINGDCMVNLKDFAEIASVWLQCS